MKKSMTIDEMKFRDEVAMRVIVYFLEQDKVSRHSAYADAGVSEENPDGLNRERRAAAVQAYRVADEMLYVRNKNINSYKD